MSENKNAEFYLRDGKIRLLLVICICARWHDARETYESVKQTEHSSFSMMPIVYSTNSQHI